MLERHIQFVRVEQPPSPTETTAEARVRLGAKFPRPTLRRMTHLGLLTGAALDGLELRPDDAVIYASTYAETQALEDYLTSFPAASPLLFQTSIHPSAVQQVLIGRQQAIGRFWPMAGRARLVESALLAALLEPAPRTLVLGGEERGTWLLEQNAASDRAFAFGLLLGHEPAGAIGRVGFEPDGNSPPGPVPTLAAFSDALACRQPLHWHGAGGTWTLAWT